jgi:1-pyrroline-4-hydroxy-2-carboxylate deaminase
MKTNWQGVFPATAMQFAADLTLDIDATLRHYDALIESGVNGLIILGTVGENCSLEFAEKLALVKSVVDHVAGRVPVLTGVAEHTTALACRFAVTAQELGVDGLMVLPGMGYQADSRETITHFRSVAQAVDLPIMCYNNPIAYRVDVTPPMFSELADEPRIVAIKESSGDTRRITDLKNRCGDRYALFCGVDDLILESIAVGAVGWVAGLVNAFPMENRLLWDLATAGDFDAAREVYSWYAPLLHLDAHVKLVQYIKLAMAECGYGSEIVRPPRLPIVGDERTQISATIRQAIATRPSIQRHVDRYRDAHSRPAASETPSPFDAAVLKCETAAH